MPTDTTISAGFRRSRADVLVLRDRKTGEISTVELAIDGTPHHVGGDCCARDRVCRGCGGRVHYQGTTFGMVYFCEGCGSDASGLER